MAYPPQHREPPGLPSIIVPGSGSHFPHMRDATISRSHAMSIPGNGPSDYVPPPLPPPRFPPIEGTPYSPQLAQDTREYTHTMASPPAGYARLGPRGHDQSSYDPKPASSVHTDEGYSSYNSTDRSRDSFPSKFGLVHSKLHKLPSPADMFSDNMKKMLDPGRHNDKSQPASLLSPSMKEMLRPRRPHMDGQAPPPLTVPVQLPYHSRGVAESPLYSGASARSTSFSHRSPGGYPSAAESMDLDRSPRAKARRKNSGDSSPPGSYGYTGAEDMELDEASHIRRLQIEEDCVTGQKRRAMSPPKEDMYFGQSHGDVVRRCGARNNRSPTPRIITNSQGPIAPSPRTSRTNSYVSTASIGSVHPSSLGQYSPAHSPAATSPTSAPSPFTTSTTIPSANTSPKISIRPGLHSRTSSTSTATARPTNGVQKLGSHKPHGFLMCECCPKKPKKFETAAELSAHEAEKQYECSYCGNRFKNKNEAERHQNSLHVRRHSWSCSALSGYDRAFHESTTRPGEADSCGYCGEEFARSGHRPGNGATNSNLPLRHATDADWDERIRHLQQTHKFRECNSSKKFYRADHFRQHLKHSHMGTSGKWTNMLENACMIEEDPSPR